MNGFVRKLVELPNLPTASGARDLADLDADDFSRLVCLLVMHCRVVGINFSVAIGGVIGISRPAVEPVTRKLGNAESHGRFGNGI
jgi:hypothetical protein